MTGVQSLGDLVSKKERCDALRREIRDETIEECARVAERNPPRLSRIAIAAAIRALKDQK